MLKLNAKKVGVGLALGMALACSAAMAQQPGQGGPGGAGPGGGGPGGGPGRMNFSMVRGTIVQAPDLQNNAVLVNTQDGQWRWVQIPANVGITKQVTVKVGELKNNDVVTVTGIPMTLNAESLEVRSDQAAAAAAAGGAQAQPQPGGPFGGPNAAPVPGAFSSITGTVVDLPEAGAEAGKPITILLPGNNKVTVTTSEKTRLTKRITATVKDLAQGDQFLAMGTMLQNNVTQATMAMSGDINNMMGGGMFGGRGPGGMFGGPGGPGGMFGGPGGPGGMGGPGGGMGGGRGGRGGMGGGRGGAGGGQGGQPGAQPAGQ